MKKPNVRRKLTWRNPLSDFSPRPYLGAPLFPSARGSEDDLKAAQILRRFYTAQRSGGEQDARRLRTYISARDKRAFVIWGDIGIGKTTFVRCELAFLRDANPGSFYYGVIDMLRASTHDAREQLERLLIDLLEDYFRDNLGGLRKGLRPYAEYKAKKHYDSSHNEELHALTNEVVEATLAATHSERANCLLDAIEIAPGPPLFIAIDNLDRAVGENQNIITDLVARRLQNSKIYLIFSLRSSSRILLDDSKILGFFDKSFMHLSAVDMHAMLRRRFEMSESGEALRDIKLPLDGRDKEDDRQITTFPELLQSFLTSEAGEFVLDLAGTNSRKVLDFVSRVIYSDQLDGISNARYPESCIAALLMLDQATFDPELSYILNLFDNEEPSAPGNCLIRYRVFEYLEQSGEVSFYERRFTNHFASLGYLGRVKEVIATFVGAGLAQTNPHRTADNVRQSELSATDIISLVKTNAAQYRKLLRSPWYFISAKNDSHIHDHLIQRNKDGTEYVRDVDFIDFLKTEEDEERRRIRDWEHKKGRNNPVITLDQPWTIARNALKKRERGSPSG
jgi:hypothetical protein